MAFQFYLNCLQDGKIQEVEQRSLFTTEQRLANIHLNVRCMIKL